MRVAGTIFLLVKAKRTILNSMDLIIIILSFVLAYGVFVLIAVKLAKIFFPKIDMDEDEVEIKPRRVRARQSKRFSI